MTERTSRLSIAVDTLGARRNVRGLEQDLKGVRAAGDSASRQTDLFARSVRGLGAAAAAYVAGVGVAGIVGDLAELQSINSRISNLTGDLAGSQQFLKSTAAELSAEYRTLANGYSRLLPLYKAGILSIEETREVTRGLANAQAATGASAADLGRVIFGLAQGLSSGTLRAEELNQVVEPMPGLLQELDRAAGLASGGFRKLTNDGKVTAEFFQKTLTAALKSYDGVAASLSDNITQTFNRTKNAYLETVQAFEEPIKDSVTPLAESMTVAFESLAANAEGITRAVQGLAIASGVAFGGQALGRLGAYGAAQLAAAQNVAALSASRLAAAEAAAVETAAQVRSTLAAQTYTALKLKEVQTQAASIAGIKRLTFVKHELAAAETAAAAATARAAAAQTAATASAATLATAQRSASISGYALAASGRAVTAALALVGGPAGAALLAAGGLAYLILRQDDAARSAEELRDVYDSLEDTFRRSPDAAAAQVDAQVERTIAEIAKLEAAQARVLQSGSLRQGAGTGSALGAEYTDAAEKAKGLQDEIDALTGKLEALRRESNEDQFFSFADHARKQVREARAEIAADVDAISKDVAKLFPDEQKVLDLENLYERVGAAQRAGFVQDKFAQKAQDAINAQIADITGLTEAREKAARDAEKYAERQRNALEEALPELGRARELNETVALLRNGMEQGGAQAQVYADAIDAVNRAFAEETGRLAAEAVEEYNEAISRRVETPFSDYADEIELLNRALSEMPEKADAINLALANLDRDATVTLTVVEDGRNEAVLADNYRRQQDALAEFHRTRQVTEEQVAENVLALAEDYASKAGALYERETEKLRGFLDTYGQQDVQGVDFQVSYDGAKAEAAAIQDAERRASRLSEVEATYQNKVTELVRSGEATRKQFTEAAAADQLSGLINQYDEQINLVGSIADSFLGLNAAREERQANEARARAEEDRRLAEEAQRAYEKNGTEANRVAAKQAKERADASEQAAKREFKQQKQAQLQQAKLSQLLAIMNAYATGGSFLTGLGLAAIAYAKTQQVIEQIKGQQYTGGGSTGGGYGGSGVSVDSNRNASDQPSVQTAAQNIYVNLFPGVFAGGADEVIATSLDRLSREGIIAQADGQPLDTRNVTQTVTFSS